MIWMRLDKMLLNELCYFKTRGASGMKNLVRRNNSNLVIGLCCFIPDLKILKKKLPLSGWVIMR
jgi:hypothetical protein